MTIKGQTPLLFVALLLLIAAGALSIYHQVNTLSYFNQEYSDAEQQVSNLIQEWKVLSLERWMLLDLGTYPRNASSLELTERIEAFIFYSNDISRENLTSRFDPLSESLNVTITYLELNQTNLDTLKDVCNKTGLSEPTPWQSYLIILSPAKIICLRLEQVNDEVFSKCVEYLSLSAPET